MDKRKWCQQLGTNFKMHGESDMKTKEERVTPKHYDVAIQPLQYIVANKLGFIEGNVVKYVTRHREKGGADDIRKAIDYLQALLREEYGQ